MPFWRETQRVYSTENHVSSKSQNKTAPKVREQRAPVATLPEIAADALVRPLLVSRRDAAVMLGRVEVGLIKRLEKQGVLHPMRLNPRSPSGQIFFNYDEIVAVARGYAPKQQTTVNDTEVEEKQPRRRRKSRGEARAGQ